MVSKICQCVDVIVSEREVSFTEGIFPDLKKFLVCNYVIYTVGSAHGQIPKLEGQGYEQDDLR